MIVIIESILLYHAHADNNCTQVTSQSDKLINSISSWSFIATEGYNIFTWDISTITKHIWVMFFFLFFFVSYERPNDVKFQVLLWMITISLFHCSLLNQRTKKTVYLLFIVLIWYISHHQFNINRFKRLQPDQPANKLQVNTFEHTTHNIS